MRRAAGVRPPGRSLARARRMEDDMALKLKYFVEGKVLTQEEFDAYVREVREEEQELYLYLPRELRLELEGYPEEIVELLNEWWEHRFDSGQDAYAEWYSSVLNGYYRHGLMAETTYRFLRDGIWEHLDW